jgi:hypothetical protein
MYAFGIVGDFGANKINTYLRAGRLGWARRDPSRRGRDEGARSTTGAGRACRPALVPTRRSGKKSRGEKRRGKVTARRGGGVWLAIVAVVAAAAVLVFLAFPGSSSVGLGVAFFMLYRLARRVEDLEAEVADLRAELGQGPSAREG